MREFVISKALQDRVAVLARGTVEDAGGIISQHTERVTEFDRLVPETGDWSRSGYIGTYKRHGEEPVRVRVKMWARWPRTLFLWTLFLGFMQALVFFGLALAGFSPPPNVWILAAVATFAVLGIALILYASSWADSQELEDVLARRLKDRLVSDDGIEGHVYTLGEWEDYTYQLREEAIERAKRQAPEQPSRPRKTWKKVTGSIGSTGAGLAQRFRGKESEAEAEAGEPGKKSGVEEEGEAEEESGQPEASWVERLAFWRSQEEGKASTEETADEGDASVKRARLEELKRQREEGND